MRSLDWYMVMMNELDEELTKRALDTRIVFISYVDTMFGFEQVTIRNPQRFSLLYAPISRSYTASITEASEIPEPLPDMRNAWKTPASAEESFAQLKHWRNTWKGPAFSYEYHFWRHQFLDPGGITFARRIYEDVRSLKVMELDGYVEDGSQRSGSPTFTIPTGYLSLRRYRNGQPVYRSAACNSALSDGGPIKIAKGRLCKKCLTK